jgi:phosphotriesterase-related protein
MKRVIGFSVICFLLVLSGCNAKKEGIIMTVNGPISANKAGITLEHEHILVDFIGADSISDSRWDKNVVEAKVLPYLKEIKELGCLTFIDCTPAYLGRDPVLLRSLSNSSGINIITNTGFYGAAKNKYLPRFAFDETADQLASVWINEWDEGIDGTGIKPGFIKIGVGSDSLSGLHKKLVIAAARTHLKTGLTIASHTGPAKPAFEEIEVLRSEGVSPEAFIWVHAQNEKDTTAHVIAARMGAWVSLDGLNDDNVTEYAAMIINMKRNHLLNKVLLSHDAGWYQPGKPNGGDFRGYTSLFKKLVPLLKKENFTDKEIRQLLVLNPAEAFTVRVRKLNNKGWAKALKLSWSRFRRLKPTVIDSKISSASEIEAPIGFENLNQLPLASANGRQVTLSILLPVLTGVRQNKNNELKPQSFPARFRRLKPTAIDPIATGLSQRSEVNKKPIDN